MKKTIWMVLVVVLLSAVVLAACGGGGGGGQTRERANPPAEFANAQNPFEGNADAVTAGRELYTTNCAGCHGDSGRGDGAAAASLDPKPANLVDTVSQTNVAYVHWVIAKGGAAANLSSSMPAFEGVLTEDQVWQVTNYVMSLK